MTKTLTEQWREGTLPEGWYYVVIEWDDEIRMLYFEGDYFLDTDVPLDNDNIKEVLAPVPDYMDCKGLIYDSINLRDARKRIDELVSKNDELVQKIHILEKQLARTKTKEYVVKVDWFSPDPVGFLSEKQTRKMFGDWKKKKEVK